MFRILATWVVGVTSLGWATEVRIASKANIENVTLGEIAAILAVQNGARAHHSAGLGGTRVVWAALLKGEIDLYAEYTGTLSQELLPGHPRDWPAIEASLHRLGLRATKPLGFNNSYAIGVTQTTASQLGLKKISDLARYPSLRFGFSHEFMNRAEGWPALKRAYGLNPEVVRSLEHEVTYLGLAEGSLDVTDLYTTDAEIEYHHLVALEDDAHLFPRYDALYVYRDALAKTAPDLIRALDDLGGTITEKAMVDMNAAVKLQKRNERSVAASFLGLKDTAHRGSIAVYTRHNTSSWSQSRCSSRS